MATYKGINGFAVQSVASDPSPLDEGQVWYNNTSYAWKLATLSTAGTWATGGNLNLARREAASATNGSATSALMISGNDSPNSGARVTNVEKYNGTSWTNSTAIPIARNSLGGSGTQDAALAFTGEIPGSALTNSTEEFDGTTWTSGGNVNNGRTVQIC